MARAGVLRVLVAAAALQMSCEGARVRSKEVDGECPPNVVINVKGHCTDASGAAVAQHCCDDYGDCRDMIDEVLPPFLADLEHYQLSCEVDEDDMAQNDAGEWEILDDSKICSAECKAGKISADDEEKGSTLKEKCQGFESMGMQLQVMSMARALNIHKRTKCPADATTATTTPPPETPEEEEKECLFAEGAGEGYINGWWRPHGVTRGRVRYQHLENPYVRVLEWSDSRQAWRIYSDNLAGHARGTLYFNKANTSLPPSDGWQVREWNWRLLFQWFDVKEPAPRMQHKPCP